MLAAMSPGLGAGAAARSMLGSGRDAGDWVPVLEEVPLFAGVSRRHLKRIAELAKPKRFAAGTTIVRTGDPGNAFYVILDGAARVAPPKGRAIKLGPGDSFGEMALLDGSPRSADVSATADVLAMTIGGAAFEKLLRREPQLTLALLRTVAARLREAQRATA